MKSQTLIIFLTFWLLCEALEDDKSMTFWPLVKKCCAKGQALDKASLKCVVPDSKSLKGQTLTSFVPQYLLNMTQTNRKDSVTRLSLSEDDIKSFGMIDEDTCPDDNKMLLDMSHPLKYLLTTEGTLVSLLGMYKINLDLGPFCFDTVVQTNHRGAVICNPCAAGSLHCIRTCCPHHQIGAYSQEGNFRCANPAKTAPLQPPDWTPSFTEPVDPDTADVALVHSGLMKSCPVNTKNANGLVLDLQDEPFNMFQNGTIYFEKNPSEMYRPANYCLAFTQVSRDGRSWSKQNIRLCVTDEQAAKAFLYTTAYPICCTVSNVFLMLTFVVYCILPDLHEPVFGKITMAFLFSLFLAYLAISVVSFGHVHLINDRGPDEIYSQGCKLLGFVVQFCFLHAFFWMNVLSYDIYRTFRRVKLSSQHSGGHGGEQARKLLFYTMYASGAPLIITLITVVIEYQPLTYTGPRPDFGLRRCFFDNDMASFLFFHLPLLGIQISNIIFFILTTRKLYETWSLTKEMQSGSSGSNSQQHNQNKSLASSHFAIIMKLFVIMGVTWLAELVGFLLSWTYGKEIVWKYFVLNDIINLLQGVLIFVVLVCKEQVVKKVMQKLHPCRDQLDKLSTTGKGESKTSTMVLGSDRLQPASNHNQAYVKDEFCEVQL